MELLDVRPGFAALARHLAAPVSRGPDRQSRLERDRFTIAILGKCGHGKSSLLNALIGEALFEASHIGAGTRTAQSVDYALPGFARDTLSILDLPGIGEAADRDEGHFELYRKAAEWASAFIYVIRADQRDLGVDQWVLSQLFGKHGRRKRLTVALAQVDKIYPINRSIPFVLSSEQSANLQAKIRTLKHKLRLKDRQIVAVAAPEAHGLDDLVLTIAGSLDQRRRLKAPPS